MSNIPDQFSPSCSRSRDATVAAVRVSARQIPTDLGSHHLIVFGTTNRRSAMTNTPADSVSLLFYERIRMVDSAQEHELRLSPPGDYSFAARTNAIPLVAEEFFPAQGHYPIVFAGSEQPRPVAVVGLAIRTRGRKPSACKPALAAELLFGPRGK
jgi:hypothetical protein